MREILFRGKRVDDGEWIIGGIVPSLNGKDFYIGNMFEATKVDPETIGQYTGLTDKNGTKFFEGDYDIDEDGEYFVYVVEFRDGAFCFVSYSQQGMLMPYGYDETAGGFGECDCLPMTDYNIETFEIRGNIHDNPKILVEEIGCDPDYFTESEEG